MNYDNLWTAVHLEINRVLAMSWNRYGNPDYCVNRLRLLAHLLIEAGDYDTPHRITREWKARYYAYAQHGGKGRFRDLLIPLTEDERARARSLRRVDDGTSPLLDPLTRVCPRCRASTGLPCRGGVDADEFHEERYDAPDAQDPMTGLTDPIALK